MKATGIVRRIDDLGRVVIPKEIRRTMRIREGDSSLKTLTQDIRFCMSVESAVHREVNTKEPPPACKKTPAAGYFSYCHNQPIFSKPISMPLFSLPSDQNSLPPF